MYCSVTIDVHLTCPAVYIMMYPMLATHILYVQLFWFCVPCSITAPCIQCPPSSFCISVHLFKAVHLPTVGASQLNARYCLGLCIV